MTAAAAATAIVREAAASAVVDVLEGASEEEKAAKAASIKQEKMRKVIRYGNQIFKFCLAAVTCCCPSLRRHRRLIDVGPQSVDITCIFCLEVFKDSFPSCLF